jgi:hypothetical protein
MTTQKEYSEIDETGSDSIGCTEAEYDVLTARTLPTPAELLSYARAAYGRSLRGLDDAAYSIAIARRDALVTAESVAACRFLGQAEKIGVAAAKR